MGEHHSSARELVNMIQSDHAHAQAHHNIIITIMSIVYIVITEENIANNNDTNKDCIYISDMQSNNSAKTER